jgi:hypothetical protein
VLEALILGVMARPPGRLKGPVVEVELDRRFRTLGDHERWSSVG